MGMDIHTRAQRRTPNGWEDVRGGFVEGADPFDWRSYGMFGFLGVATRNYSRAPAIVAEPRGLPADCGDELRDEFDGLIYKSFLSIEELLSFDYDHEFEDRRTARKVDAGYVNHAHTCDPGDGEVTTLRAFLGEDFFSDLERLKVLGAHRIVYGFDS